MYIKYKHSLVGKYALVSLIQPWVHRQEPTVPQYLDLCCTIRPLNQSSTVSHLNCIVSHLLYRNDTFSQLAMYNVISWFHLHFILLAPTQRPSNFYIAIKFELQTNANSIKLSCMGSESIVICVTSGLTCLGPWGLSRWISTFGAGFIILEVFKKKSWYLYFLKYSKCLYTWLL